jgi:hypothetical protein
MAYAPGLTPTAVLEKLGNIQMIDVCIPTCDGRWLILPRYTQPDPDLKLLLHHLRLELPSNHRHALPCLPFRLWFWPQTTHWFCSEDFDVASTESKQLNRSKRPELRK